MIRITTLLIVISFLFAHPHTFIDYEATAVFDDNGISGVETTWYFDEMFSSVVETYDENGDKKFSPAETKLLKAEAFDNLKEYNYFTKFYVSGSEFVPAEISDFEAFFNDNNIAYKFFIPCRVSAGNQTSELLIMFYDPTYYIHVDPMDNKALGLKNEKGYAVEVVHEKKKEYAYYQRAIIPEGFRVWFQKQ